MDEPPGERIPTGTALMRSLPVGVVLVGSSDLTHRHERVRPMHQEAFLFGEAMISLDKALLIRPLGGIILGWCLHTAKSASRRRERPVLGHYPSIRDSNHKSACGLPSRRKKGTTASQDVSARNSSRTTASTKMEVPASTRIEHLHHVHPLLIGIGRRHTGILACPYESPQAARVVESRLCCRWGGSRRRLCGRRIFQRVATEQGIQTPNWACS